MKTATLTALMLLFLFAPLLSHSQLLASTEDGRTVILNKNGTYKFAKKESASPLITEKDFKIVGESVKVPNRKLSVFDASNNSVVVDFTYESNKRQYNYINSAKLMAMIVLANAETMYKMKNKYSYIPKKIDVYYNEHFSNWVVAIDYLAENDYGASKNGLAKAKFTSSGEFSDVDFN